MLTIHITEADPAAGAAAPPESQDGLAVCLAQHGVPPDVVHTALAALAHVKAVRLCQRSEERAWEIQAHGRPRRLPGGLPRGVSHRRTSSLATSRLKTSRPPTNATLLDGLSCCA
jgi:hypothetical protein